jgi:hypothetical protein
LKLLKDKTIDYEHALAKCSNPQDFNRRAMNAGLVEVAASGIR